MFNSTHNMHAALANDDNDNDDDEQEIIDAIVDKNPKDNDGVTPLHLAAKYCHLDICNLIIEMIEDKNSQTNSRDTPLDFAVMNGHYKIFSSDFFKKTFSLL